MTAGNRTTWKCQSCYEKGNPNYLATITTRNQTKKETCRSQSPTLPARRNNSDLVEDDMSPNSSRDASQNETLCLKPTKLPTEKEMHDKVDCTGIQNTEMMLFLNEMRAMRLEMSEFRETMAELTSTIVAQNKRLDQLESRIDALESKNTESKSDQVALLEQTIEQLRSEIQERDQEMLTNDIEISNLPETSNENPTHLLLTVAKKLGVDLCERDVVSAQRAGPPRAPAQGGAAPRPRPLVARLARLAPRDELLRAARVRRGLSTEGMGMPGTPCSFYINEHLSRPNRQLFQKAREAARNNNWKYVWTREGKIFARQEQGKARHRLRLEADIAKVFGANIVSDSRH